VRCRITASQPLSRWGSSCLFSLQEGVISGKNSGSIRVRAATSSVLGLGSFKLGYDS
jgi:hypothetical protein